MRKQHRGIVFLVAGADGLAAARTELGNNSRAVVITAVGRRIAVANSWTSRHTSVVGGAIPLVRRGRQILTSIICRHGPVK